MESSSIERAAVSAAQAPEWVNPAGALFPIERVLGAATEWRTHGVHYVTFDSKRLKSEIRLGYSIDYEDEYPEPLLLEVYAGGIDWSEGLEKAVYGVLEDELADAVREEEAREITAAQERRAEDRQLELTL